MIRTIAMFTVAVALAACATVATTVGFPAADADDNDLISVSEFRNVWDDMDIFEKFDDDNNGNLNRTEYNTAVDNPYETDTYWRGFDKNRDNMLSRDEFIDGWFTMFDADRSGSHNRSEFRSAMESLEVEL